MTTSHDHPRVSALVPTVNRPDLLRQTLGGIVDQDYPGVIDTLVHFDGTDPDMSLESTSDLRPIRVMQNPAGRSGLAAARNTMIAATDGPIVAFCDDDDVWLPGKTTPQVALLVARPEVEVVATGMIVEGKERAVTRVWDADQVTIDDLITSRVQDVHPSSLVMRRSALDAIGPVDESLPGSYGEDHDLMIRAARRCPIQVVREPLVRVRWQQQSLFADKWQVLIDAIDALIDKHPEFLTNDVGMARMVGRKAFALASLERHPEARRTAREALRLNPRDLRGWAALAVGSHLLTSPRAQHLANSAGRGI